MYQGTCPTCEVDIDIKKEIIDGELINCRECGVDLEVSKKDENIQLIAAPEIEEDWGE